CAAPSAKGDDKFITTDYLQQCRSNYPEPTVKLTASILLPSLTPISQYVFRDSQGRTERKVTLIVRFQRCF
ncbi:MULTISPECIES: hypothetical protein, partial [Enterobacterales]